jgi:hypothetical protein
MPQLNLNFTEIPVPETCLWEQFHEEQKRLVVEALARLPTKASRGDQHQEQSNDD